MKLQIIEIIKYAWKTLWANASVWAGIMAILIAINGVQGLFGYQEAVQVDVTTNDWAQYGAGQITADELSLLDLTYSFQALSGNEGDAPVTETFTLEEESGNLAIDLIATILSFVIGIGVLTTSIAHVRKQKKNIIEAVTEQEFMTYPRYFFGSLLVGFLVILGLILLIIPGIIVALMLSFALYAIVDQKVGIFEALSVSNKMTSGHRWQILGMVFVTIGINILGALALLIGLLVTIPLTYLVWARVYDLLLTKEDTQDNNVQQEKGEVIEVEEVEDGDTTEDDDDVIEVEEVEEGDTTKK